MIEREVLLVAFRAHAHPLGEDALEMRRAHRHARGQRLERQGRIGGVDLVDGAADHVVVVFLVIGHGQM
jgi:hypothetical protein